MQSSAAAVAAADYCFWRVHSLARVRLKSPRRRRLRVVAVLCERERAYTRAALLTFWLGVGCLITHFVFVIARFALRVLLRVYSILWRAALAILPQALIYIRFFCFALGATQDDAELRLFSRFVARIARARLRLVAATETPPAAQRQRQQRQQQQQQQQQRRRARAPQSSP